MNTVTFGQTAPVAFALRSDIHLLRKFWHVVTGVTGLFIYFVFHIGQFEMASGLVSLALFAFLFESLRIRSSKVNNITLAIMGPFLRESERNSYSGLPFYALGTGLSLFMYEERVAILSVMFLVFSDPVSSYFGIRYGKNKIVGNKSIQGAFAGFVTCYFVCLSYGLVLNLAGVDLLIFSLIAGVLGSAAELLSTKVDDNLTIPIVSGLGLTILNALFGLF